VIHNFISANFYAESRVCDIKNHFQEYKKNVISLEILINREFVGFLLIILDNFFALLGMESHTLSLLVKLLALFNYSPRLHVL
jgi:hypothetical protein